jgi:peptidyl-tRNA hydrolase
LNKNKSLRIRKKILELKTKNFKRLRIGIKTKALDNIPGLKYVLQRFNAEELKILSKVIENI